MTTTQELMLAAIEWLAAEGVHASMNDGLIGLATIVEGKKVFSRAAAKKALSRCHRQVHGAPTVQRMRKPVASRASGSFYLSKEWRELRQ